MKKFWFSSAMFMMVTTETLAINTNIDSFEQHDANLIDEWLLAQIESEQLPAAANPIAQAKESMKELKSMVEQSDAKNMGYAEFNVFKKLRAMLRKKTKHSEQVFQNLKTLLKNGWEGKDGKKHT